MSQVVQSNGRGAVEWTTVGLLLAFAMAYGSLLAFHASVPWPLQFVLFVYLGGMWMSIGHELLHGHPTKWNWVNNTLGFLPLSLWLPFTRYKASHIKHHRCNLTDPIDDPESSYVLPATWDRAGRPQRAFLLALRSALGRFTLGVPRSVVRYVVHDVKVTRRHPHVGVHWLTHAIAAVVLGWWLFGVVGVSPWVYVFGFVLGGSACTQLRSFVEHKAVAEGTRSAVVKAGPVMSLLFLNINLHHTHHAQPDVAWYLIPKLHREMGSDAIAADGAGLYEGGYVQVLRMYFWHPFGNPRHPLS